MEVAGKRLETDNVAEFCEPCVAVNLSKHADGFCKDCNDFMCQKCFRHHLKAKLCRDHVLNPLNGASSQGTQRVQEEKCKKHANETIKYYCRTHNAVGCGDCLVSDHQKCDTEFIIDLAKNYDESSEFKILLKQIQKWVTDKAENETRIETNREKNKTLLDKALKDVRNFRREINNWLDKMEKKLEAEVKSISNDNENQMSQLEVKIQNISSEIDTIKEQLDSNVYNAVNLFIRHIEYMTRIGQVDKTLSEIQSENVIKSYTFEPEAKVEDMVKSSVKLGIVRVNREMLTQKKQPTEGQFSGEIGIRVKEAIKTEKKQSVESEYSAKENVYQFPDPRANGFDVGKRVAAAWDTNMHGTVSSVQPSGCASVKWDRFSGTFQYYSTNSLKLL